MRQKILFPTDFSEASERALRYALQLYEGVIEKEGLVVLVLHVDVPITTMHPEVGAYVSAADTERNVATKKTRLADLISKLTKNYANVSFEEKFVVGPIHPTIREIAMEAHVDLIAMGASGLGPLERTILGSTAVALCKKAPCPVLVVPEHALLRVPRRGVLSTDFKNLKNPHILEPLKELVHRMHMNLMLLHIHQGEEDMVTGNLEQAKELTEYFATDKFNYHFLEDDDKLTAIEDFISGYHADLLAVIAQERKFFAELFHVSLTKKLIFHARVPLLVLHSIFWDDEKDDEETFREKAKEQLSHWKSEVDHLKVQAHLGKKELTNQIQQGKKRADQVLHEVSAKLDDVGDITRERWDHFQREISEAIRHVKRAFTGD